MSQPTDEEQPQTILSVRLGRLGVPGDLQEPRLTFGELGLLPLAQQAVYWQQVRANSWFAEINTMFKGVHQQDRWRELGQLFGSAAESTLLVCAAEVEIAMLRRAIREGKLDAAWYMAVRFFGESQGHQVLGFGHRCANIVLRALVLDAGYPFSWTRKRPRVPPVFSGDKDDWPPLSEIDTMTQIAQASPHPGLQQLSATLRDLWSSKEWRALDHLRARDFHQARRESPIVARSPRATAWEEQPGQRTLSLGPDSTPTLEQATAEIDDLLATVRGAVDLLPAFMERFLEDWQQAADTLGHGQRTDDGRLRFKTL